MRPLLPCPDRCWARARGVKARGWTALPQFLNNSAGRREVRELSGGNDEVPALVLDSGEFIQGSREIIDWAAANPATAPAA